MFAVGGMLVFPAANDLLTMFVALEVLSLPLYLMCGLARRRRLLSQEAALKYFLLGAFSSAFFLYGVALLYGYAGTLSLVGIRRRDRRRTRARRRWRWSASRCCRSACCSRSAPSRSTRGSPTSTRARRHPITGFMAAATKVAAFGALLRIFYVALPGSAHDWRPVLWAIAILTMVVGTITAVTQTDVKRMLAYSSVAHVGFILTGVIADNEAGLSVDAVLPGRLRLQHASARSPSSAWSATPTARKTTTWRAGRGWGSAHPLWAWCSRCSCWPSPASR